MNVLTRIPIPEVKFSSIIEFSFIKPVIFLKIVLASTVLKIRYGLHRPYNRFTALSTLGHV